MYKPPVKINRRIHFLLEKMNIDATPVFVNVKPEKWALVNDCFPNVSRMVNENSGNMILGWALYESDILVEAVYHAIYKTPNNELVDITPNIYSFSKILFVEDKNSPYIGATRDNFRVNPSGNPLVDDFIHIYEAEHKIKNYKQRAYTTEIRLSKFEFSILQYIENIKVPLELFILRGNTSDSICFCGSNRKYYECHMKEISELIKEINKNYSE
jgi:hypothetical protein